MEEGHRFYVMGGAGGELLAVCSSNARRKCKTPPPSDEGSNKYTVERFCGGHELIPYLLSNKTIER